MSTLKESTPPKVFISYAWKNQSLAKQLQRDLQRDGVELFVDYEKIKGGDSLPARISKALEWCNTLLLLWSSDAAKSDWVAQEWENALQLKKRIIPCILNGAELPALLRRLLYIDFSSYETGYAQLCRALGVAPKVSSEKNGSPETKGERSPKIETEKTSPRAKIPKAISSTITQLSQFKRKPSPGTKEGAKSKTFPWRRRNILMTITFLLIVAAMIYLAVRYYQSQIESKKSTYGMLLNASRNCAAF